MRFENRSQPLLPRVQFAARMARHFLATLALVAAALLLGTLGYHAIAGFTWIDAFLNASMILTGMGPVDHLPSDGAKLFASFYALFCGIVFVAMLGILIAPVAHRVLHRFHLESRREESDGDEDR